jgi:putative addiction module component (TIGR02574 family)
MKHLALLEKMGDQADLRAVRTAKHLGLKDQLLTLNQPDRAALACFLLDSLDDKDGKPESEIEKTWYDEAERRVLAYKAGQTLAMSLEEAVEEVSRAYL